MNWAAAHAVWPNAAFSRFTTIGHIRWHLQIAGEGPTVLFLHGAGASTHSWRDILPPLSRETRVVALDLPGQGFSRTTRHDLCGLDPMAADIATLLGRLDTRPDIIVGHSAGGAIGLRLALDLPQKPAAVVTLNAALGSFDGPAAHLFPALARGLATSGVAASLFSTLGASRRVVRHLIESTGSHLDARGIDLYRMLLSDPDHVAGTLAMMAHWKLDRLTADLPRVAVPTLLMVGDGDLAVPPSTSVRARDVIPGAVLERTPLLGHLMHEEEPERFTAAFSHVVFGSGTKATDP